ncbi:hypothetical protein BBJ28_00021819 [Nothophytophthora sp. Chile5]|nr:hypothetical protein BBJ28_00021819 [Nothophytophthora sp. Chile5]
MHHFAPVVLQPSHRRGGGADGSRHVTTWSQYLQLYSPANAWLDDARALRLLSSAYSYVLTLSTFLPELMETDSAPHAQELKLHVIGARAEAMMPRYLWDELVFFHADMRFDIKLIGDHVPVMRTRKPKTTGQKMEDSTSGVRLEMINGLYHELEAGKLQTPDAFVLYNPGVGHPRLRESWRSTLEIVLASRKPVLITSFSVEDQQRDVVALQDLVATSPVLKQQQLRFRCRAKQNSFRNLKFQVDPTNIGMPIQTNNRVMVVQVVDGSEGSSV